MIEFFEVSDKLKLGCYVLFNIEIGDSLYLFYSSARGEDEANIFVSRLVKTSMGDELFNDFSNGEKDNLDNVFKELINSDKFIFSDYKMNNDIRPLVGSKFSKDLCYVCTMSKGDLLSFLNKYHLKVDKRRPVIKVDKEKFVTSEKAESVLLILLGIFVLLLSCLVIFNFFNK